MTDKAAQEPLHKKDEALSAAQRAASEAAAQRDALAQQLKASEQEVARLRAGPTTDDVKVGAAQRTLVPLHGARREFQLCGSFI